MNKNRKVILRPGLPPIPPVGRAPRKIVRSKPASPEAQNRPDKFAAEIDGAENATLAKPSKKYRKRDSTIMRSLGLADVLVTHVAPAERVKVKRPATPAEIANLAKARAAMGDRLRLWQMKPIGTRAWDQLLRVMEPGKAYVVRDLVGPSGLKYNSVTAYIRQKMPRWGMVERIPAPAGMAHSGPLKYGTRHKDPVTWLWRLSRKGIAERWAVAEADQAAEGGSHKAEGEWPLAASQAAPS